MITDTENWMAAIYIWSNKCNLVEHKRLNKNNMCIIYNIYNKKKYNMKYERKMSMGTQNVNILVIFLKECIQQCHVCGCVDVYL